MPHLGPVGEPFDLGIIVYPNDATVARDHPVRLVVSDTLERRSPRGGDDPRRVFGMHESLPQLRVGEPLIGREAEDVFRTPAQLLEQTAPGASAYSYTYVMIAGRSIPRILWGVERRRRVITRFG